MADGAEVDDAAPESLANQRKRRKRYEPSEDELKKIEDILLRFPRPAHLNHEYEFETGTMSEKEVRAALRYKGESGAGISLEEAKERLENILEMEHFARVCRAFDYYPEWMDRKFQVKIRDWGRLPEWQRKLLPGMDQKWAQIRQCIATNGRFAKELLTCRDLFWEIPQDIWEKQMQHIPANFNMDKVRSTIKQFARDWSKTCETERNLSYGPLLAELEKLYPDKDQRSNIRVLNPGCGLARLVWEIAMRGFNVQGNEYSYFMLLASAYTLNCLRQPGCWTIHPWLGQVNNNLCTQDQLDPVLFPDVNPGVIAERGLRYSMAAGDFNEVYRKEPGSFDCLVTCFFLDTAANVMNYLETINTLLKPGGHWINMGPLLYHFEEMNDPSIELSYEEIRSLFPHFGLTLLSEQANKPAFYTQNPKSMQRMYYSCVHLVCQKTGPMTKKSPPDKQKSPPGDPQKAEQVPNGT